VLNLKPTEWICCVTGVNGKSYHQAGSVGVDAVDIHTNMGRSFGVHGSSVAPHPGAPGWHIVVDEMAVGAPDVVVRAVIGRSGDSLDGLAFILGPPIPSIWTTATHHLFPTRTRKAIRAVLLGSRRANTVFALLNRDCTLSLCAAIAAWHQHGFLNGCEHFA